MQNLFLGESTNLETDSFPFSTWDIELSATFGYHEVPQFHTPPCFAG